MNETFEILGLLRNTYHNNGVYRGKNNIGPFDFGDGMVFEFSPGKEIECAGWKHVFFVLHKIAGYLNEILLHSDLKHVKIADHFQQTQVKKLSLKGVFSAP